MLIEIPNGDWIDPRTVSGLRLIAGDAHGPRVIIDTRQQAAHHIIDFDLPDAARAWCADFGRLCVAATIPQPVAQ